MPCAGCNKGRKTAPQTFNIPVKTVASSKQFNSGKGALFGGNSQPRTTLKN